MKQFLDVQFEILMPLNWVLNTNCLDRDDSIEDIHYMRLLMYALLPFAIAVLSYLVAVINGLATGTSIT